MAVMREGVSIMTSDSVSRDKNSMSDFKKKRARNIFFGDEVSARKSERVCLLESRVQKMADNEVPAGAPQTTLAHHDAHLSFTEHRRRLGGNLTEKAPKLRRKAEAKLIDSVPKSDGSSSGGGRAPLSAHSTRSTTLTAREEEARNVPIYSGAMWDKVPENFPPLRSCLSTALSPLGAAASSGLRISPGFRFGSGSVCGPGSAGPQGSPPFFAPEYFSGQLGGVFGNQGSASAGALPVASIGSGSMGTGLFHPPSATSFPDSIFSGVMSGGVGGDAGFPGSELVYPFQQRYAVQPAGSTLPLSTYSGTPSIPSGGPNGAQLPVPSGPAATESTMEDQVQRTNEGVATRVYYKYKAVGPDGTLYKIDNLVTFCRVFGLSVDMMYKVAAKRIKNHRGWECEKAGTDEQDELHADTNYRYLSKDLIRQHEKETCLKLYELGIPAVAASSSADEANSSPVRKKKKSLKGDHFTLPPGWAVERRQRRTGVSQGAKYTVYKSPDDRVFRTRAEVILHEKARQEVSMRRLTAAGASSDGGIGTRQS